MPRIYFVPADEAGTFEQWPAVFERAASLGFSHILLSPPFAARGPELIEDFHRVHSAIRPDADAATFLRDVVQLAAAHGLRLLLDVEPDAVAAHGSAAQEYADVFRAPIEPAPLDPRTYPDHPELAFARYDDAPARVAEWLARRMGEWCEAGVSGFRITSLAHIPPDVLRDAIRQLRDAGHAAHLIGWTAGLSAERLALFAGCGLDFTIASLPWWNFRADWFWQELDRLNRIASPLLPAALPFAAREFDRLASASHLIRAHSRAALFAGTVGQGWIMPMGFERVAEGADADALTTAI